MPRDTAPATDPNLTTRTTGNPDTVDSTHRPHFLLRSRIPGHIRNSQSQDPAQSMVAKLTQVIPQTTHRTQYPTIPAVCRSCRHSRVPRATRTPGWTLLVEAPTPHLPTEARTRHTTRMHSTQSPNPTMPHLVAKRMDPPARAKFWALRLAKLQCTTASMSPSPSTIIRPPRLLAQLRLPAHRLKREIVELHIHAAATGSGTAKTGLVADKESRRGARHTGDNIP
jgi:hypothetical protein